MEEALAHITNRQTNTYSAYYSNSGWNTASGLIQWNSYLNAALAALNAGQSLWLGSLGATSDNSGKRNLIAGHAFAITSYNPGSGRFTVSNPWGAGNSTYAGVFQASWQDFYNVKGFVSWV